LDAGATCSAAAWLPREHGIPGAFWEQGGRAMGQRLSLSLIPVLVLTDQSQTCPLVPSGPGHSHLLEKCSNAQIDFEISNLKYDNVPD
jgi:hypothetical protein